MTFIESFKEAIAKATPKVTAFPAMVFPIYTDDGRLHAEREPVLSWEGIDEIEKRRDFVGWAGDPRTGEVNIKIDQDDLTKSVRAWVESTGPTRPH